jgi:hypothetical protein
MTQPLCNVSGRRFARRIRHDPLGRASCFESAGEGAAFRGRPFPCAARLSCSVIARVAEPSKDVSPTNAWPRSLSVGSQFPVFNICVNCRPIVSAVCSSKLKLWSRLCGRKAEATVYREEPESRKRLLEPRPDRLAPGRTERNWRHLSICRSQTVIFLSQLPAAA